MVVMMMLDAELHHSKWHHPLQALQSTLLSRNDSWHIVASDEKLHYHHQYHHRHHHIFIIIIIIIITLIILNHQAYTYIHL
jgi:hypothetical protein